MVLPTTLTMASARCPRRLASRNAPSVSAVSPDCEMHQQDGVPLRRRVAVEEFVRELDFHGHVREFFDQVFADQRRVPARAVAAMTMRSILAQFPGVMFKPPNFAVAPSKSTRPRKAFSTVRGCSKISLSMKCGNLPRSASSEAEFQMRLTWTLAPFGAEILNVETVRVSVATS
jgi:hypothetical protein